MKCTDFRRHRDFHIFLERTFLKEFGQEMEVTPENLRRAYRLEIPLGWWVAHVAKDDQAHASVVEATRAPEVSLSGLSVNATRAYAAIYRLLTADMHTYAREEAERRYVNRRNCVQYAEKAVSRKLHEKFRDKVVETVMEAHSRLKEKR